MSNYEATVQLRCRRLKLNWRARVSLFCDQLPAFLAILLYQVEAGGLRIMAQCSHCDHAAKREAFQLVA